MNTILFALMVVAVIAFIAIRFKRNSDEVKAIIEEARVRAAERRVERAYFDTEPAEDPYERAYTLSGAMSAVEVDESANGYGMLSDEQKQVISAIFDMGPVTNKMLAKEGDGMIVGNKWAGSVFSDLNQVEPIPEKDIWSNSRQ